ncbi:MAG: MFS transporter [Cyclobacteriaceae bacterium]|nr:MFS transporter [Cyclobacteriaceae bacterium]
MSRIVQLYKNAFGGLSRPAWMLAVVMLINRSGTMVLPFLGIYLTSALGFSLQQAGVVLSSFGIGAMIGSFLGGVLTDRFGHFYVQILSLVLGGLMFVALSFVTGYHQLIVGILLLSITAESFRPANSSSVSFYARPQNISRAFSLNRMAINLGFSIGPALGGLLAGISYRWLFVADGTTCILAGLFFYFYFRNVKGNEPGKEINEARKSTTTSAFRDKRFMAFSVLATGFAILFFQLFFTLPIYYKEVYHLSAGKIGGLLALNGIIVFSVEMILVYILGRSFPIHKLVFLGLVLVGFGFVLLNLFEAAPILVVSMVVLSLAEILAMPFMITFVVERSGIKNRGSYMGLYSFSFSAGHVFSPILGSFIIGHYGFAMLWWLSGLASLLVGAGLWIVTKR